MSASAGKFGGVRPALRAIVALGCCAWVGGAAVAADMSPPGRPKGEFRSAQHEGTPVSVDNDPTQLSLEQLLDLDIQSASKFTQKASEAPSSVTVVSAADIRRFGYRRLADVLNSIRGLYVHYDRNYHYLGVRGFGPLGSYNSRVLVMVDGYRLNDPIYGQGSIGLEFPVDVDLIDRVEFVPGPGSAIYGNNAFFGVINVITRRGKSIGGLEASAEAGSWDSYKGRLTWGRRYANDLDVLISVSGYSSQGRDRHYAEFEQPGASDGVARGLDGERAPDAFGKATWGGFTLQAVHRKRTKQVPTASFQTIFNGEPGQQTRDTQTFAELRYEGGIARDTELSARVNRGSYDYRGQYPIADELSAATVVNVDVARSTWWGSEVRLLNRSFSGHKIVLGAEYQRNTRKDQTNYDVDPPLTYLDERHRSWQSGLYLQDEVTLRPDLVINAGLRYDHHSTFGSITNPRLALIYSVDPAITLKALYGKAYRAPNDGELFFSSERLGWRSNPDLSPERIDTQELVGEWRVSSLTRATLSAFRYRITDLITLTTDGGRQTYLNQGTAHARGVQGEFERLWRNGSAVRASYSQQRAEDERGDRLVNSPRHLAKFDGTMPLFGDALRGGLSLRHVGSRLTRSDAKAAAYTTADLTLSSERLFRDAEVSFSIYNVFDNTYRDPVSDAHLQDALRQDGRSVRLKLTAQF